MSKRTTVRSPARKGVTRKGQSPPELLPDDREERSWQQMYIISQRWQSDLAFFNDELKFFRKLIDKYFMWLADDKNIESVRKLASDLYRFEKRRFTVSQRLSLHVHQLTNLVGNSSSHNAQGCKDEHGQLEVIFAEFTKDFRRIKSEVFIASEKVIDSEKVKRFFNGS